MTDDDMEIISVRLPLKRCEVASLDRLADAMNIARKSRTAYIYSLLMTSIEDEMADHAAEKAA